MDTSKQIFLYSQSSDHNGSLKDTDKKFVVNLKRPNLIGMKKFRLIH